MIFNCPECGKEISTEAEYCPNCGVAVKPDTKKGKTSPAVVVFLILAVILLGLLVAFNFIQNKSMFTVPSGDSETVAAGIPSGAKKIEVGSESDYFPLGTDQLSFGSGDKSTCVCSKIAPLTGGYYSVEFTVPMLSNASAVGTYGAVISYTVKVGDSINMRDFSSYYSRAKKLNIKYLAPNICYYEVE